MRHRVYICIYLYKYMYFSVDLNSTPMSRWLQIQQHFYTHIGVIMTEIIKTIEKLLEQLKEAKENNDAEKFKEIMQQLERAIVERDK